MTGKRCYNQMLPKEQEEISSQFSNGKTAMPGVGGIIPFRLALVIVFLFKSC